MKLKEDDPKVTTSTVDLSKGTNKLASMNTDPKECERKIKELVDLDVEAKNNKNKIQFDYEMIMMQISQDFSMRILNYQP